MAKVSLGELSRLLDAELRGDADPDRQVQGLRSLAEAGPDELSFLHQAAYKEEAAKSQAAALLLPRSLAAQVVPAGGGGRAVLLVDNSQLAVAKALAFFHPRQRPAAGVHETAVLGEGVVVGEGVAIAPYVVIGDGSVIGDQAVIEAHVVIGRGCRLGREVWLHPGVVLYDRTELGDRTEIHSGAVLGADGFGYASVRGVHHKVPQVGRVVLGADVEVGANSTIDRATLEATRIGAGSKIDNLVQVGHNVETGKGCILCGQAGIAGSAKLGDYVVLGGQAGVSGHLELGLGVQVAAASAALQTVEAGRQVAGIPAVPLADWRRQVAALPRLGELLRRVKRLEKELERLGGAGSPPAESEVES